MLSKVIFTISGMHCVSCGMNIDGELEDARGVREARTNYAKGETEVEFDDSEISISDIIKLIKSLEYEAEVKK